MPKALKHIVPIVMLLAGMIWIPFWFIMSGTVCILWHGFGVDELGNVYVGKEESIDIYNEDHCIGAIDIPRFRSYRMTIESDIIIVATSQYVYKYDTYGNELSRTEDIDGQIHAHIGKSLKSTYASDGTEYKAQTFGRHQITRDDGTVVYQMPVLDFAIKLLYIISIFSFAALGVMETVKRKHSK